MRKRILTFACGVLVTSMLTITPGVASAAGGFLPYDDISKHWARSSIIRGVEAGLFAAGSKVPHFYPNREMTRAEFVAMLDRVYQGGQYQLYPLTFLSEHAELSKGEGFAEPYLPYKDVDRLTWMYGPTLRVSFLLDRLYGPGSIQTVFPGENMSPNQAISQDEAAKLLLMFTMGEDSSLALEEVKSWGWLEGEKNDKLKRGEAAAAADRLMQYLMQDPILPLLDYDGQKFPMVPEIQDVFPLFATYTAQKSVEEQKYVDAVDAIINQMDSEQTYSDLRKLETRSFPNQIGAHYYLSWDPNITLEDNLNEAFLAIDAYFEDKIILPETLQLLSANVYDLALQMGSSDSKIYGKVLERLSTYESKVKEDTDEWESLVIYLAALEIKAGKIDDALTRYRSFAAENHEALTNVTYYLIAQDRMAEAEELVTSLSPYKNDTRMVQLVKLLKQDISSLKEQSAIALDLAYSLRKMDRASTMQVKGESVLSGYLFKYTQDIDREKKASRTTGYFQSPYKRILDPMDSYTDTKDRIHYTYDSESEQWVKNRINKLDFLHEWVGAKNINERIRDLNARYYKQSYGRYDVITEWIPRPFLEEKGRQVVLGKGKILSAPLYMNKYYIDRESDQLIQHFWRYEEIYESQEYVAYSGTDIYEYNANVKVTIPEQVKNEVSR
ncbi:S-layer homology domain-containing protein [Brevibacillus invocatus]|uniref:S-layer homology domain-containing protein n=1 Tax=Brevibacillus invocatus TaxID=173959 RepID=A0A3M8CM92_9BACL|nr:S-layer homology domain-containing protein [Brevibacillus invocatus]RNB76814.1 S-layer homology domain-containing protein [Brevibacillus invocatus]